MSDRVFYELIRDPTLDEMAMLMDLLAGSNHCIIDVEPGRLIDRDQIDYEAMALYLDAVCRMRTLTGEHIRAALGVGEDDDE